MSLVSFTVVTWTHPAHTWILRWSNSCSLVWSSIFSFLKVDLSKLTQSTETSGWLFFLALMSAKHPQLPLGSCPEQSVQSLCWQLRTIKNHSISAHLLQAILLHLAAHFVVKQCNENGTQQHCCSIWWNGIEWMSIAGVDVTVQITNNRMICVIGTSVTTDRLCQYLTDVISDILSTVLRVSPKLAAAAYIVHPQKVAISSADITATPPINLFPVEGIRNSINEHEEFVLSLKNAAIIKFGGLQSLNYFKVVHPLWRTLR